MPQSRFGQRQTRTRARLLEGKKKEVSELPAKLQAMSAEQSTWILSRLWMVHEAALADVDTVWDALGPSREIAADLVIACIPISNSHVI